MARLAGRHRVHNIEVEGVHTYIAGGFRVHNKEVPPIALDLDGDGSTTDTITAGAHVTNNERIGVANTAGGGGGGGSSQAPNPPTNLRVVSQ